MECALCNIGEYRIVKKTKYSVAYVIIEPLKTGHLMVSPRRHEEDISKLSPAEAHDLLSLVEQMRVTVSRLGQDAEIVLQKGSHSTQPHLHFHVLPSKVAIRDWFSKCEGVPHRKRLSKKELQEMRDRILSLGIN